MHAFNQNNQSTLSLRLLVFTALLMTVGCAHVREWQHQKKVGPQYVPPVAAMPTDWSQFNGPHVIADKNAVDNTDWWNVFNDPELTCIVSAANQNYLPLQTAKLRIQEQNYLKEIAVGNLFPQQQQRFAEYQRNQFSENGNSFGIPGIGNSFDLYRAGFNASWEIDIWGRLRRQIESAEANVHISVEDERDIHLSLMADVISTYIEIRVIQQRLQITNSQIEAQQETVRLAKARLDIGASGSLDVSQANATLASFEANIPLLESQLKVANNKLCLLLGVPTKDLFTPENLGEIPSAPNAIVVGAPWDLLRRRPDIRRAEREVAAQSALIGVAAADLFPTFSLRGQISWESFNLSNLFSDGSFGGSIIPGVRWNILNYGRIKNNVNVQKTRLEQRILDYRQTVLQANTEAQDALTVHVKKNEEFAAIKSAIDATEKALETATQQYQEGEVDLDRVNNLRKDLIAQLDLHTVTRGEAALALVRVFQTMGGGWTPGNWNHNSSPACQQLVRSNSGVPTNHGCDANPQMFDCQNLDHIGSCVTDGLDVGSDSNKWMSQFISQGISSSPQLASTDRGTGQRHVTTVQTAGHQTPVTRPVAARPNVYLPKVAPRPEIALRPVSQQVAPANHHPTHYQLQRHANLPEGAGTLKRYPLF